MGAKPDSIVRREVLQLGMLGGLSLLAGMPQAAFAATQDDADFLAVSRALIGRQDLSLALNEALLAAFRKNDPSFDSKLSQLRGIIGDGTVSSDMVTEKIAGAHADVAGLPQAILSGWYLGIVGSGDKAICVAYVDALANREVADVLRPQSYSYGAYGSWASRPV